MNSQTMWYKFDVNFKYEKKVCDMCVCVYPWEFWIV